MIDETAFVDSLFAPELRSSSGFATTSSSVSATAATTGLLPSTTANLPDCRYGPRTSIKVEPLAQSRQPLHMHMHLTVANEDEAMLRHLLQEVEDPSLPQSSHRVANTCPDLLAPGQDQEPSGDLFDPLDISKVGDVKDSFSSLDDSPENTPTTKQVWSELRPAASVSVSTPSAMSSISSISFMPMAMMGPTVSSLLPSELNSALDLLRSSSSGTNGDDPTGYSVSMRLLEESVNALLPSSLQAASTMPLLVSTSMLTPTAPASSPSPVKPKISKKRVHAIYEPNEESFGDSTNTPAIKEEAVDSIDSTMPGCTSILDDTSTISSGIKPAPAVKSTPNAAVKIIHPSANRSIKPRATPIKVEPQEDDSVVVKTEPSLINDTRKQAAQVAQEIAASSQKGVKGKKCVEPGCDRRAQSNSRCKAHGGGARCQFREADGTCCPRSSQGGGFCRAHGGGKRCQFPGCTRGQQRKGRCYVHGGIRRCQVANCEKKDRGNGFCISHGGGKRCSFPGCSRAVRRGTLCQSHEDTGTLPPSMVEQPRTAPPCGV